MTETAQSYQDLQAKCARQEQEIAELKKDLQFFKEQFELSRAQKFGPKSEASPGQLNLFNEVELESSASVKKTTVKSHERKPRGSNKLDLNQLPTETIEYQLSEKELDCSCCSGKLHQMSTETRSELHVLPPQFKQVKHVRHVYSCRQCEQKGTSTNIVTAKMPAPAFPGSIASSSLVAHIINEKYVESRPLYRQEKAFERHGLAISRQNMANWVVAGAQNWLKPLYERAKTELMKEKILHADETKLQVLNEPERAATSKSYMWLYRSGRHGPPIVLYDYRTTRASKHPRRFLADFKGYLHVDGYSGYNNLPDITLVGCWAHARRKFDEALKALPEESKTTEVAAKEGLAFINQLFKLEKDFKDLSIKERYRKRLKLSQPLVDQFYEWLAFQRPRVLPKSAFGTAINYCFNQRENLENFLLDGHLELDNNRAERSIKPFVLGRKNWLFSNTPKGAESSAITYSIVETAKENGLNPFWYIKYLFEVMPGTDLNDPDAVAALLPWSKSLPAECYSCKPQEQAG